MPSALPFEYARPAHRGSWWGRLLLLASALMLVYAFLQLGHAWTAQNREAAALADLEARALAASGKAAIPQRPDPAEAARIRTARQMADSLMTPWADLLAALEEAPQHAVALLSVEPSVSKQSIRLVAEARDPIAMIDYLGALQRDKRLADVVLVSHQIQEQAPGSPLRFQLQAAWGALP